MIALPGTLHSVSFEGVAVTAVQDLFEITFPSTAVGAIVSCEVSQDNIEGDANAEMLRMNIVKYASSGSGGTAATERALAGNFAAAGAAVEVNNTTQGTTPTLFHATAWNLQASPGFLYKPTQAELIVCSPSEIIAIELPVAPAASTTMSGTIYWIEIGG